MFNTGFQPTGIYGNFQSMQTVSKPQQIQTQTNVQSVLDGHEMSEPVQTESKKKKSVLPAVVAVGVAVIAATWAMPAIRTSIFGARLEEPFEKIFKNPGKKMPELDPLKKAFVKTADCMDEKICSPVRNFLHKHIFAYKKP